MEDIEKKKKRVYELVSILNEANYNYYALDNPTITDQEYDKYNRELIDIETEYNFNDKDADTIPELALTFADISDQPSSPRPPASPPPPNADPAMP